MTALKMCVMMLFHPIVVSEHIKKQRGVPEFRRLSVILVLAILALALAVNIFSIYFTHYPLATVSVRKANLLLECGKLFVPVLTWVLASYAMTTILDGGTKMGEAMLYNALTLVPYVAFTVPAVLLSRLMDGGQAGVYGVITGGLLLWVVALMIIGIKEMNEYNAAKTLLVVLLTVFTMAVIWATAVLLFTISSQFVTMIREVYYEIIYRM
ncbi:MAG: hypothetical protein IKP22_00955 [Clostridia bacterium]|nr:hypothetical protein [Clostridia bacterium]MBR4500447.1 hypothetical protein [Clostridia bacterium]